MRVGYQKYSLCFGILCGFFLTLQAFQGTFKKTLVEKPLKISIQTRQFLKQSLQLQRSLVPLLVVSSVTQQVPLESIRSMIHLSDLIVNSCQITPLNLQNLLEIIDQAKHIVFQHSPEGQTKIQNSRLQAWLSYVLENLKSIQAEGCEYDVVDLRKQIVTLQQMMKNNALFDRVAMHSLIVRSVGLCSEIMQRFDGFFVTDYDLLVLSHLALALVVLDF